MARLLGRDHSAAGGFELGYQSQLLLRSADRVPRQPEAVGMAHLRFAVVFFQGLGGKDELPQGGQVFHIHASFIEGVDGELPVDSHRLATLLVAEHDPAAKTALRRLALRVPHGIGPHVGQHNGDSWLGRFVAPRKLVGQIELGTAAKRAKDASRLHAPRNTPNPRLWSIRGIFSLSWILARLCVTKPDC